jgi:hypothetical protein
MGGTWKIPSVNSVLETLLVSMSHSLVLHPSQITIHFDFFRYIIFAMYLEKPKRIVIWDGGSSSFMDGRSME